MRGSKQECESGLTAAIRRRCGNLHRIPEIRDAHVHSPEEAAPGERFWRWRKWDDFAVLAGRCGAVHLLRTYGRWGAAGEYHRTCSSCFGRPDGCDVAAERSTR